MKFDLKQFKAIEDDGDRFAYALENLKELGEGGSRTAFLLSSRFALKVAHTDRGKSQNATEAAVSSDPKLGQFIARVHSHASDFSWVVSDLVKPLTSEEEFDKLFGMPFDEFINAVQGGDYHKWVGNPNWKVKSKSIYPGKGDETIGTYGMIDAFRTLVKTKKLHTPELQFIDHWGKTGDGRVVILDYGVDNNNWKSQTIHAHREGQQRGLGPSHRNTYNSHASVSEPILEGQKFDKREFLLLPRQEKIIYARKWLQKLGIGSSRAVYRLSPKYALKIALGNDGVSQNRNEVNFATNPGVSPIVCKVADHDGTYEWIVVELAKTMSSHQEFLQLSGVSWKLFSTCLDKDSEDGRLEDFLPDLEFVRDVQHALDIGLDHYDLSRLNQWGKTADGRLVVMDTGVLSESVLRTFEK